jgi:DNA ligase-1
VQVHKQDDEVRVYSRLLNDVTIAVPELVEEVRALPARELILDGEVIALRPDGTPHSFQTTMRRFGRRLDVERLRAELPLTPFFFDLLRRDGLICWISRSASARVPWWTPLRSASCRGA